MKKTSLYLGEDDIERLQRLAQRAGKSQAEIVRVALEAYERYILPDRNFTLTASGAGDGRRITDIPDDELFAGFGEPELLGEPER